MCLPEETVFWIPNAAITIVHGPAGANRQRLLLVTVSSERVSKAAKDAERQPAALRSRRHHHRRDKIQQHAACVPNVGQKLPSRYFARRAFACRMMVWIYVVLFIAPMSPSLVSRMAAAPVIGQPRSAKLGRGQAREVSYLTQRKT